MSIELPVERVNQIRDVLNSAFTELYGQMQVYPQGFTPDRNGIRMGIAAAEDELHEAWEEWHRWKKLPLTEGAKAGQWKTTRDELLQAACVLLYTVAEIDRVNP